MSRTEPPPGVNAVQPALFDFQASPGRFSIALKEPRILFEQAHAVLWLAAGRQGSQARTNAHEHTAIQQAARFFVRHAFLRPGTDHYTLLGLPVDAGESTVREHYRLLIRLTHPDFASPTDAWPANAAARVNLAYDVLSNPGKRKDYDHQRPQPPLPATPQVAAHPQALPSQASLGRKASPPKRRKTYLFSGIAAFAAVTMLVLLLVSTPPEDTSLQVSMAPAPSLAPTGIQEALALAPNPKPANPSRQTRDAAPPPQVNTVHVDKAPATAPVVASAKPSESRVQVLPSPEQVTLGEADESTPPLRLSLSLAKVESSEPGTETADLKVPAPTIAPSLPGNVQAAAPVVASAPPRALPETAPLDMRQVHPLLADLVEHLQSGNGQQVQEWIERQALLGGSAASFTTAYTRAIAGGRVTGLGQVRFAPRAKSSPQQVDGMVQLNLLQTDLQTSVKNFRLRAYFEVHPDGPRLSRLEAE